MPAVAICSMPSKIKQSLGAMVATSLHVGRVGRMGRSTDDRERDEGG
jgi:hypothetical protein